MANKNSVTLTFGYTNTDFQRKYKFEDVDQTALSGVKAKVLALNASIADGSKASLKTIFRSDDYDASDADEIVGEFKGIVAAQFDEMTTTEIDLA